MKGNLRPSDFRCQNYLYNTEGDRRTKRDRMTKNDRRTKEDRMTKRTEGQKRQNNKKWKDRRRRTEGDLLCIHDFIIIEN